ncbi:COMPASS (complex proteins associated with Set1p) component [Orbilia blumenaviensis]|uniref:COMPASS (Complex proteins associated with Set1p) component n=1 Tax=Orbilia blumenaviensis TaxID=1796055 RepID=A0AAV9V0M9_9PEZI
MMADPMDTDQQQQLPIEQSLEGVLFPTSTSTPPPNTTTATTTARQFSRLSHPPPPIDSPVLSAAQTPSKPSPPNMSMGGGSNVGTPTPSAMTPMPSAAITTVNLGGGGGGANGKGAVMGDGRGAGAPVRQYLNQFVTPHLLEGMKIIARDQPANPLEALGRYLLQQSQIYENATSSGIGYNQDGGIGIGIGVGTPRAEVKMEDTA